MTEINKRESNTNINFRSKFFVSLNCHKEYYNLKLYFINKLIYK